SRDHKALRRCPALLPCKPRTRRRRPAESPNTEFCGWSCRVFERLANGFVADRLHDAQFYHLLRQEAKRPIRESLRRLAQSQSDHFRFLLAIENLLPWRR